jgi:mannose/fructose/N-acetylgalactosamine-specific phosphotransferase system component IIB
VKPPILRVDDRLVHGQVLAGWVAALALERMVLVNDAVAADPFEREIYGSAVPPEVELVILPLVGAVMAGMALTARRAIWLVESLSDAFALVEQGLPVESINIGGIHAAAGRSEVLPFVWLSAAERKLCRRLAGAGVRLEARMLPTAVPHDLAALLERGTNLDGDEPA